MREIDYRALRLLMDRSHGHRISKDRELRKFDLHWKRGDLYYAEDEPEEQKWWRCEARFALGDYSDYTGWHNRHKWTKRCHLENPFPVPQWRGQPVDKLYIIAEQGLGDEVMLSQTVLDAKKVVKEAVLECQARMCSVLSRGLGVECVAAVVQDDGVRLSQQFEADAWVNLGDLPRIYRRTWNDFPRKAYLTPDPQRCLELARYAGRTGISWRGAQGAIPFRELTRLYPDAISLQYDQQGDEHYVEIPEVNLKDDIEGIFALCSVLSRIVTVSTSVAHFASAMGCEVDLVVADPNTGVRSHILPWRWMDFSQKRVPRQPWWYPATTKVYASMREYLAYQ